MKLILKLLVPVADTETVAVEMDAFLLPLVVSKVISTTPPLVLAATTMAPLWSILLLDVKVMFVPLAALMAPD